MAKRLHFDDALSEPARTLMISREEEREICWRALELVSLLGTEQAALCRELAEREVLWGEDFTEH